MSTRANPRFELEDAETGEVFGWAKSTTRKGAMHDALMLAHNRGFAIRVRPEHGKPKIVHPPGPRRLGRNPGKSRRFERCVKSVKASARRSGRSVTSPEAVCASSLRKTGWTPQGNPSRDQLLKAIKRSGMTVAEFQNKMEQAIAEQEVIAKGGTPYKARLAAAHIRAAKRDLAKIAGANPCAGLHFHAGDLRAQNARKRNSAKFAGAWSKRKVKGWGHVQSFQDGKQAMDHARESAKNRPTADYMVTKDAGESYPYSVWERPGVRMANPSGSASAAIALTKKFHGKADGKTKAITEQEKFHADVAELGELIELEVATLSGYHVTLADFGGAMLTASPDGKQYFILGGVQELPLSKIGMGGEWVKDKMVIGKIKKLVYRTSKQFDHNEVIDYSHRSGEVLIGGKRVVRGPAPFLLYDNLNKKMSIGGGQYYTTWKGVER